MAKLAEDPLDPHAHTDDKVAESALRPPSLAEFKGQPLPKTKVEVTTPSGWAQTHHTDANGKFSTTLPWSGPYVLELAHQDATPGERSATDKYDRASYVTSLTVYQSTGIAPLPAPPAAAPNK